MSRPLMVAAMTAVLMLPAAAAAQDTGTDLQEARDQLAEQRRSVEQLDRELAVAQSELAEVDGRLVVAGQQLHEIEGALASAEAARAEAAEAAQRSGQRLQAANAALEQTRDALADRQSRLDRRIRDVYKHGADAGALLLEGVVRSTSMHDMSTTVRAVRRIAATDTALVHDAAEATLAEADARIDVATAHGEHRALENAATRERDRVATLVARQQAVVSAIEEDRAARQAIVDRIAGDRQAAAHLVESLQQRVSELAAQLAAALIAADPTAGFDGPVPSWASALPGRGRTWAPAIAGTAARAGVDARLYAALVWSESSFHPGAVSHAGAIGLAQLMPGTAAGLGVDPWDPIQNLLGGARYLRIQLERFGATDLALAAYNAGPRRVEGAGYQIPEIVETQLYVVRVLDRFQTLIEADAG